MTQISRGDLRLARNIAEATEAELAANSALRRAFYEVAAGSIGGWRTDGAVYGWRFGQSEVRVSITDELGRIDINFASTDLLTDLFEAAGARYPEALAEAVDAFRKQRRAQTLRAGVSPSADILTELGLGVPFTSTEDLQNVAGISQALVQRLRPSITVYSGRALPVIAAAPPLVRAAVNAADISTSAMPNTYLEVPAEGLTEAPTLLSAPPGPGTRGSGVYRIQAEALTAGGSHFAREAVVALRSKRQKVPYDVRLWRRGARLHFPHSQ
ncbi:type II secretion system protein GspK [Marimonas arenosa]|uniref:Type II secretion system protein GspK n=1 Tax=Marimonas arenosa TaxID=1795305 RepID=A0AAE3WE56_9RHOB|nr:type II secretion system protein GspK [Marimonas arenosa]